MKFLKNKSLLGITFEGNCMTVAELRRAGNQLEIRRTMRTTLTLDLLTSDPELLGREMRNHLDYAKIREKRCVVCVPLKWVLTLHLELPPALSEEDIESFIHLQAEREFPFPPEDLSLSVSPFNTSDNARWATVVALPVHHLNTLQKALNAARLHPVSITLGLSSLLPLKEESDAMILVSHEEGIDMGIFAKGGIATVRFLPHRIENGPKGNTFEIDMIVRELRITLGCIPQAIRDKIRSVWISGVPDLKEPLFKQTRLSLTRIGMSVKQVTPDVGAQLGENHLINQISPYAYTVASRRLLDQICEFEFLPPKMDRFKQIAGRISARGALWLACSVIVLIVIVTAGFLLQYYYVARLEKKWKMMEPTVTNVEKLQKKLRQYRPWFDDSIPSLTVLKMLTTAFPEDSAVSVRSLEIKGLSKIVCSGDAKSNKDLLKTLERLRGISRIEELQVLYVRGNDPLQFTFSFRWSGG